jgi:hypothetical protein
MIKIRLKPIEYCLVAAMACVAIFSFTDMGFLKLLEHPSAEQIIESWAGDYLVDKPTHNA